VAGWPARAVEFYRCLGYCQTLKHLHPERGCTVDLRQGDTLDRLQGPFDELAHTVDVRSVCSSSQGRYNIPSVGVFVWPVKTFSVTRAPACFPERKQRPYGYTFSILGQDTPLFTKSEPEPEPTHIAGEMNLPVPIRRRAFRDNTASYYGEDKSLQIWLGDLAHPVSRDKIVAADLSDWDYRPQKDQVAVDPETGRIAFSPRQAPRRGVIVSYHYGFSKEMGGGEYERILTQPEGSAFYRVGEGAEHKSINDALCSWQKDKPNDAVIEIMDSDVYEPETEEEGEKKINIELDKGKSLQIRAANGVRPVIRLLDYYVSRQDNLTIIGKKGSRFTLDGLMITNQGIRIEGGLRRVVIRHCTLVPGLAPLELVNLTGVVNIEHSILGRMLVNRDEVTDDPMLINISDSILDGGSAEAIALDAPNEDASSCCSSK